MSTVVITGATGFIGGRLVAYLGQRGHQIVAFGRRPHGPKGPSVAYIPWDITRPDAPTTGTRPDVVVHCAAHVSDWGTHEDLYPVNVVGTAHVLRAFPSARQFIYVSTASVYDPYGPKSFMQEDDAYDGPYLNAYAATKRLAEHLVQQSKRPNRVIVRPHIVYGPHDTTLLPRLMRARRLGMVPLIGDGANRLSLTYIDNLCRSIELIMQRQFTFEIFNVADETVATAQAIMHDLLTTLGWTEKVIHVDARVALRSATVLEAAYRALRRPGPPPLTRYLVTQMASEFTLDLGKARRLLGYEPAYDYHAGFSELRAWLDAQSVQNPLLT